MMTDYSRCSSLDRKPGSTGHITSGRISNFRSPPESGGHANDLPVIKCLDLIDQEATSATRPC